MKIPKQEYTAEFKELTVKRVRDGQSVGAVAKELGLVEGRSIGSDSIDSAYRVSNRISIESDPESDFVTSPRAGTGAKIFLRASFLDLTQMLCILISRT